MIKVITYGTFDLLHFGHINLLKRAKELGDYLIVAVTSDSFDKQRGKINVEQSLVERIDAVRALNIADEIIVEEYEGQKVHDILKYNVDIFTVGSDWVGKFDYLNEYCKVVYLERTEGVSSTMIRSNENHLKLCLVSNEKQVMKNIADCSSINGLEISNVIFDKDLDFDKYKKVISDVDAVFFSSSIDKFAYIKETIEQQKDVYVETPLSFSKTECEILHKNAKENDVLLFEGNKTFFSTAFNRLCLLSKSGSVGKVMSINLTMTLNENLCIKQALPIALLTPLQILGTNYTSLSHKTFAIDNKIVHKIEIVYENAVANIEICDGVKSEESLTISGTNGYIFVPAPWYKTEYFEIRFDNLSQNRRYFYKYDTDSIRGEMIAFVKAIRQNEQGISQKTSTALATMLENLKDI